MAIRSQVYICEDPGTRLALSAFGISCWDAAYCCLPGSVSKPTSFVYDDTPADFRFQTPWNLWNRPFVWRFFLFGKTLRFWYLLCHGLYSWAVVKTSGTHGNEYKSSLQLVEYESLDRSAGTEWPRLSWRWFPWYLRIDGSQRCVPKCWKIRISDIWYLISNGDDSASSWFEHLFLNLFFYRKNPTLSKSWVPEEVNISAFDYSIQLLPGRYVVEIHFNS